MQECFASWHGKTASQREGMGGSIVLSTIEFN